MQGKQLSDEVMQNDKSTDFHMKLDVMLRAESDTHKKN